LNDYKYLERIMKHYLLILFVFSTKLVFSQTGKVEMKNLKPAFKDYKYPEVYYSANPKVAEKTNTFLQLDDLEHLPGIFKKHPFEKIVYGASEYGTSVDFYSWKQFKTTKNILSFSTDGEASGAYPEGFESFHNFDLRTGDPILLKTLFTKTAVIQLEKILNRKVKSTIEDYLKTIRLVTEEKSQAKGDEADLDEQIQMYDECLERVQSGDMEYYEFYFKQDSITFVRGRCSNHALRALDDLDKYYISFSYKEISKYLSPYGKQLIEDSKINYTLSSPEGRMFKGKINDKYPISLVIKKIYEDGSLSLQYWYDKVKQPIEWRGQFKNNHFSLTEDDYHSEELKKWIPRANIEADWIDHKKIIGTWTNYKTREVLKIELDLY
jgi:hypothetical protein